MVKQKRRFRRRPCCLINMITLLLCLCTLSFKVCDAAGSKDSSLETTTSGSPSLNVVVHTEALKNRFASKNSFSQIEIRNNHKHESITIHSAEVESETTVRRHRFGSSSESETASSFQSGGDHSDVDDINHYFDENISLPKQIQVMKVSGIDGGPVIVGPNQAAVISMMFLPRFPHRRKSEISQTDSLYYALKGQGVSEMNDNPNLGVGISSFIRNEVDIAGDLGQNDQLHSNQPRMPRTSSSSGDVQRPNQYGNTVPIEQEQPHHHSNYNVDSSYYYNNNNHQTTRKQYSVHRLNNLGYDPAVDEEYEVTATIKVLASMENGSPEPMDIPIKASSRRYNDFGIPDTIVFSNPTLMKEQDHHLSNPNLSGQPPRNKPRVGKGTVHSSNFKISSDDAMIYRPHLLLNNDKGCYDLHINNPSHSKKLIIDRITRSHGSLTDMSFNSEYSRMGSVSSPKGILRAWDGKDGPFIIAPGYKHVYIGKLCVNTTEIINNNGTSNVNQDNSTRIIRYPSFQPGTTIKNELHVGNFDQMDLGNVKYSLGFLKIHYTIGGSSNDVVIFLQLDEPRPTAISSLNSNSTMAGKIDDSRIKSFFSSPFASAASVDVDANGNTDEFNDYMDIMDGPEMPKTSSIEVKNINKHEDGSSNADLVLHLDIDDMDTFLDGLLDDSNKVLSDLAKNALLSKQGQEQLAAKLPKDHVVTSINSMETATVKTPLFKTNLYGFDERTGRQIPKVMFGLKQLIPSLLYKLLKFYCSKEVNRGDADCSNNTYNVKDWSKSSGKDYPIVQPYSKLLQARPSRIAFQIITSVGKKSRYQLELHNKYSKPIRIVMVTASMVITDEALDYGFELLLQNKDDVTIAKMACEAPNTAYVEGNSYHTLLEPNQVDKNAMFLTVAVSKYPPNNITEPIVFEGSILIRATQDLNIDRINWQKRIKSDPRFDMEFSLEIPFTVTMSPGKVSFVLDNYNIPTGNNHSFENVRGLLSKKYQEQYEAYSNMNPIAALYFPRYVNQYDWEIPSGNSGKLDSDGIPLIPTNNINHVYNPDGSVEILRHVRLISDVALPMSMLKINILSNSADGNYAPNLCNSFSFGTKEIITHENIDDANQYDGLDAFELGEILIWYKPQKVQYGKNKMNKDNLDDFYYDFTIAKGCYLGVHLNIGNKKGLGVLPLFVHEGKLEISTSSMGNQDVPYELFNHFGKTYKDQLEKSITASSATSGAIATIGFDATVKRLESILMGNVLQSSLTKANKNMKLPINPLCGSKSLVESSKYARLFCQFLLENTEGAILAASKGSGIKRDYSKSILSPILLEIGAVGHDEIKTTSLYVTNHNPVPININLDSDKAQGMSIVLGQCTGRFKGDLRSVLDYLPNYDDDEKASKLVPEGNFKGFPLQGLKQYLLKSEYSTNLFSRLSERDDVAISSVAIQALPYLKGLYRKNPLVTFSSNRRINDPPAYEQCVTNTGSNGKSPQISGPLLVSSIGQKFSLKLCNNDYNSVQDNSTATSRIHLAPGAVARFDVHLRAPPKKNLKKDVSPLLSTGLVISTDKGQLMPIILAYEALLGQIKVSNPTRRHETISNVVLPNAKVRIPRHDFTATGVFDDNTNNITVIEVPVGLFQQNSDNPVNKSGTRTVVIPPKKAAPTNISFTEFQANSSNDYGQEYEMDNSDSHHDVPLYLTSTFSHDINLKNVESCNPLFTVSLKRPESEDISIGDMHQPESAVSEAGVEIGTLHNFFSCAFRNDSGTSFTDEIFGSIPNYPSFYLCALNWLKNRSFLQPRGCGVAPDRPISHFAGRQGDNNHHYSEDEVVERAIKALENVVSYLNLNYEGWETLPSDHQQLPQSHSNAGDTQKKRKPSRPYKFSGGKGDGMVTPKKIQLFAEVENAWKAVSELGLHKISTSLTATINYTYPRLRASDDIEDRSRQTKDTETGGTRSLTVSMSEVAIQTSLATPKLIDERRIINETSHETKMKTLKSGIISVFEFPPTQIANVATLTIPVRNPTSVPVRVRLAAAFPSGDKDEIIEVADVKDKVRMNYDTVYIQHNEHGNDGCASFWWDNGGAYFLNDDEGNLIQAQHNLSIRAGAGAVVQLRNPSLHTSTAFMAGCGLRCGDRNENDQTSPQTFFGKMPKQISPIGASAASGKTLLGRPSLDTYVDGMPIQDPHLNAGGYPPYHKGPAPFAIPFAALDEIVLPPYAEGDIGPILFRPPGRRNILGCDFPPNGPEEPEDTTRSDPCESEYFQSMLFLENSLTGLERVIVRGKSLWEKVVFLDPEPEHRSSDDVEEAYGDIEYRHGHSTLVFPGTSEIDGVEVGKPVIKKVVVHNSGDVPVDFGSVYFSDSSIGRFGNRRNLFDIPRSNRNNKNIDGNDDHCSIRNFRLAGCWDDSRANQDHYMQRNLRQGFHLAPGQNRTLYIQHKPDCTLSQEYVTLNLEYRSQNHTEESNVAAVEGMSRFARIQRAKAKKWKKTFKRRKIELLVGFDMNAYDMKHCVPVQDGDQSMHTTGLVRSIFEILPSRKVKDGDKNFWNASTTNEFTSDEDRPRGGFYVGAMTILVAVSCLTMTVSHGVGSRHLSSLFFRYALGGKTVDNKSTETNSNQLNHISNNNNWSAAFRCLARADPTSSELQSLGGEQVRQVVLNRYKNVGIVAPQSLNTFGITHHREDVSGGASRRSSTKDGGISSGGGIKVRTMSDAIFQSFEPARDNVSHLAGILPCRLGWRSAARRGIGKVDPNVALEKSGLPRRVQDIQIRRRLNNAKAYEQSSPSRQAARKSGSTNEAANESESKSEIENHTKDTNGAAKGVSTSDSETCSTTVNVMPDNKSSAKPVMEEENTTNKEAENDDSQWVQAGRNRKEKGGSSHTSNAKNPEQRNSSQLRKTAVRADFQQTQKVQHNKPKKVTEKSNEPAATQNRKEIKNVKDVARNPKAKNAGPSKEKAKPAKEKQAWQKDRPANQAGGENSTEPSNGKAKVPAKQSARKAENSKKSKKSTGGSKNSSRTKSTDSPRSPSWSHTTPNGDMALSPSSGPSPTIRPPPGLAPPPGFNKNAGSMPKIPNIEKASLMDQAELGSALTPRDDVGVDSRKEFGGIYSASPITSPTGPTALIPGSPMLETGTPSLIGELGGQALPELPLISSSTNNRASEPIGKPPASTNAGEAIGLPAAAADDSDPLLGLGGSGFNVMDFLDSVLDEPQPTPATDESNPPQGGVPNNLPGNLQSNLWGERKSRAAAYGIAFEEEEAEAGDGDIVHSLLSNAGLSSEGSQSTPLLIPEIMGISESKSNDEDDVDETSRYFNFSSLQKFVDDEDED